MERLRVFMVTAASTGRWWMSEPTGELSFDGFYVSTRRRLLGHLALMTGDVDQAQDVVQEAFVRAWQRWERVRTLDDPEGWVRTVAWRLAVSRWRRARLALRLQPRVATPATAPSPPTDEVLDVRAALARLPEGQRLVLVLHELCDLSVEQVAQQTGLPVGTVKTRLMRGRAALAAQLGTHVEEADNVQPA